ncbi:MAG: cysteine synthase A [Salinarchaeum sp.]
MTIATDVTDLIGETPLLRVEDFAPNLVVKLESFNPYSVKDRIARSMIETAEADGSIDANTTVIEPTSGNTGIGLATVCASKGYELVLTMPESMSQERRRLLRALGAEIELTPAEEGMSGAIARAEALHDELDNTFVPGQFENPANAVAHRQTTGPELYEATDGELETFVAGVGTGGTVTGVGQYFEEDRDTDLEVIGVEPAESAVLSGAAPGSHGIQGIGAGFVPDVLERDRLDAVRTVTYEDAVTATRRLAEEEGIAGGISTGANLHVAAEVAAEREGLVATIVCDPGERYLSTDLYA